VTGNSLVWRQLLFAPITTSKIRVWVTGAVDKWTRITEVEAYTSTGGNVSPLVTLDSPANGTTYTEPATVTLAATATDVDGTVDHVTFYADGAPLGSDTSAPYSFDWPNVPAGTYTLTAVATDDQGAASPASNAVSVTVYPAVGGGVNVALAANGGTATASSTNSSGYAPAGAINGDRTGAPWGKGGGWNDGTPNVWPDWLEVAFSAPHAIGEVDVFSMQDNYRSPSEPTPTMTFTKYGLTDFEVQYWTGTAWAAIPGGTVTGNSLVWRQLLFAPITTSKIRVWVTGAVDKWTRITEVEAYTVATGAGLAHTPAAGDEIIDATRLADRSMPVGGRTHALALREPNPALRKPSR
jgi:Bacterial Ig domain